MLNARKQIPKARIALWVSLFSTVLLLGVAAFYCYQVVNLNQRTDQREPTLQMDELSGWSTLFRFAGNGQFSTHRLRVGQLWKLKWSCRSNGHITITINDATGKSEKVVNTACSTDGEDFSNLNGTISLDVNSSTSWIVEVEK